MRAVLFFMVYKMKDPTSPLFFIVTPLIHIGFFLVLIVLMAYIQKLYPKEIRGTLSAIQGIMTTLGLLALNLVCEWGYEKGVAIPFLIVTITDIVMTVVCILLFAFTRFGTTDMTLR
mmetsp:Transcript_11155/g.18731  ORF Transcript_11155/g.18731 Transcript_11155/m.18731 type:complete len:117 (-) Transcript_11155:221-571(-)